MNWIPKLFLFLIFITSTHEFNLYGPPKEATLMERPFQATILRNGVYHCSGAIISKKCVLTACSCIINPDKTKRTPYKYSVITNSSAFPNRRSKSNRVSTLFVTEGCREDDYEWNAAILCVRTALPGQPVTIVKDQTRENVRGIVSGWSLSEKGGISIQNHLQRAYMKIINLDECRRWYAGIRDVPDTAICAVASDGVRGFCAGDVGAPLTHGPGLIGIAVTSFGCRRLKYPGLFMNVSMLAGQAEDIVKDFETEIEFDN